MLYQIKNAEGQYSRGGAYTYGIWTAKNSKRRGKIWGTLNAFASHLAQHVDIKERLAEKPASLFKVYGGCTVIEIDDSGVESARPAVREIKFEDWYQEYFNTSAKFAPIRNQRRKEERRLKKNPNCWTDDEIATVIKFLKAGENFCTSHARPIVAETSNVLENERVGNYFTVTLNGITYALCKLV